MRVLIYDLPIVRYILVLVIAGLVGACGAGEQPGPPPAAESPAPGAERVAAPLLDLAAGEMAPANPAPAVERCEPGEMRGMRSRKRAYAAVALDRTVAYSRPGGEAFHTFRRLNVNGYPTVFGVLEAVLDERCRPAWYHVQLPLRPNGATGYVRAADVEVAVVVTHIEVDLSERRINFYREGRRVLTATAAIGADTTPTPTGSYYVNQRLVAPDPWGTFGPAALGISAFSPVLQDWAQGGPIAIHGTNDPSSIGQAVSHGCLRVRNEEIEILFREALAGTPVEIRA